MRVCAAALGGKAQNAGCTRAAKPGLLDWECEPACGDACGCLPLNSGAQRPHCRRRFRARVWEMEASAGVTGGRLDTGPAG
jgi:hypothetical protein